MAAPIKIYAGNIPSSARNSELKELFEKFGKVVECDILKDFGFVHMEDTNDAKAAIAGLNDTVWKGSRIRVEISTTKTNKGEPSQRYRGPMERGGGGGHMGMSRGIGGPAMMGYHRDSPYGMGGGSPVSNGMMMGGGGGMPMRTARNGPPNGGGPIRDTRYGNGGPAAAAAAAMGGGASRYGMPDRGRPYPDAFEHRGGPGAPGMRPMPPGMQMAARAPQMTDYGLPPAAYRGAPIGMGGGGGPIGNGMIGPPGGDMRGLSNGSMGGGVGGQPDHPYMRGPPMGQQQQQQHPGMQMQQQAPQQPMHDDYYRGPVGPPGPPGMQSRYEFDHYGGPPPRGSFFA